VIDVMPEPIRHSREPASPQPAGLIFVTEDEPDVAGLVASMLRRAHFDVESFFDGESCLEGLSRAMPDAICLDLAMPGIGGLETLKRIRARHPHLPVLILTGNASIETAVRAMRDGAYDYIVKPIDRGLLARVRKAIEWAGMNGRLHELELEQHGYPGIIGGSAVMKDLYRQMDRVATRDVSVVVRGESGTGKELVARAIHAVGARQEGPFVALNCAAIPETLQESELFGHERGAFTGATARYRGRFEQANGGTLFLDEVAELAQPLQAKLLRVLQDRRFHSVGGYGEIRSDFRLIAATHQDLAAEVRQGSFREDLFYRIAVVELDVPPLRERVDDILLLADRFIAEFTEKNRIEYHPALAPATLEALARHSWPGNVRELRNVVQRAVIVARGGEIQPGDLPASVLDKDSALGSSVESGDGGAPAAGGSTGDKGDAEALNLEAVERQAIEDAIRIAAGNLSKVGRLLGISRNTLYRKLKKYRLEELRTRLYRLAS
jgi:two-component system, NtrC family, response regulator HydG